MGKYRGKPIEATQWFKNGDHPEDNCGTFDAGDGPFQGEGHIVRYYRRPDVDEQSKCSRCGLIMHLHGWIDSAREGQAFSYDVCPGDYIVGRIESELYPCKPDIFEAEYEPNPVFSMDTTGVVTIDGDLSIKDIRVNGDSPSS